MMTQVRVEIDLNSVRADGTTRVRLSRASGRLDRGQIVTAFEPEEGIAGLAFVDRVDPESGYAFITVNRGSLRDDDGDEGYDFVSRNMNRAVAQLSNERAQSSSGATVRRATLRRPLSR